MLWFTNIANSNFAQFLGSEAHLLNNEFQHSKWYPLSTASDVDALFAAAHRHHTRTLPP